VSARPKFAALSAVRWLTAAVLLAALAGCATSGGQHILKAEEQRASATIVPGLRELPLVALKWDPNEEVTMMLEANSEQKSFAIAGPQGETEIVQLLKLPPWSAPYGISLTSFAVGGLADPALFYPKLVFLDENFRTTRQTRQSDFVYRSVGAQGGISTNVFVNEANRSDAYLAIFSENRHGITEQDSVMQSSSAVPVVVPIGPYIVTWVVPTGGAELPKKLRALAVGPVRLRIAPYGKAGKI
jgi:hypothetical protein